MKSPINSSYEFKTVCLCVQALTVTFKALVEERVKKIEPRHLQVWIAPTTKAMTDDADVEAKVPSEGNLSGEQLHGVRKVLDSYRDKKTNAMYYLVDWMTTWEPRQNLSQTLIANFTKERRALVRMVYIENETVEDHSMHPR